VPHLNLFPAAETKMTKWVTKEPVIKTEYYTSDTLVDIVNYKDRYDLKHTCILIRKGREKAIITVLSKSVSIEYQRKSKIILEFDTKENARAYWLALQPSDEISDLKEYLKRYNKTWLNSI
jgi:hypothetical protein